MSRTGRSMIHSVLTAKDLESFVETYKIPKRFSPTLPGPDESTECTPDQIALYTLAFSSCGVRYPLSPFKIALLRHFGVHFSQLHPLGFKRVVHFELSCVAVSGEPSVPLFCMFYKLISDGDWFTFAKRQNSVSRPCYSFMPTSTYPKEWKSRFIFVSTAMIPESPPPRDAEAAIEDSIPALSVAETVQWKRVCENPTRAFTFSEGILAMGGLSPSYSVHPRAFFGKKELTLWRLLQGDSRDVKFVVGDEVEPGLNRDVEVQVVGGSVQTGGPVAVEESEGASSDGEESSPDPLQAGHSDRDDEEDLESRLVCKRKAVSPKPVPAPRDIRQRLRSASGQKVPPATKAVSELPPIGVKGSLSKHLRSSSLVSAPLLGSSHDPIEIPTGLSSSRVRDKTPEVSIARIASAFEVSPHHATGTSKPSQFEGLACRSPLAPLFADALPFTYVPKWKITHSSVIGTPETARDFLSHVVPPSHRFMNSALRDDIFEDQYSMSLCESFFRGASMLQRVDDLRKENEELKGELKTS
uniref:Transposase (putative) gypsy type domain-containing protein n=1 Tax=Helianthus annuus TaxID=4232 RepID=A0A251TNS5_HELAN